MCVSNKDSASFTGGQAGASGGGLLGDLLAAEAMLDLLRLPVGKYFAGNFLECRQESAVVAASHALRIVHRARLAYADALAVAESAGRPR